MVKKKPVHIKEVIERFMGGENQKFSTPHQVINNWSKIISRGAAPYTAPLSIKNKILIITVSSSAWLHQLTLDRPKILKKIKQIVGDNKIDDIRLKIGKPQA